jgi:dTDP-4-dehydrorhamnose 3,5-epimerase
VRFTPTDLPDVVLVDIEAREDERGFFARTFCAREFEEAGLNPVVAQANLASSRLAGTLRGLHYQRPPAAEAKLLRCTRGRIFDVAVDIRPASPTYLRHVGVTLDADDRRAIYVPEGFAHGYLTLSDDAEVSYQASAPYAPGAEAGIRWDDPALGIAWPHPVLVVSEKDASWPDVGGAR